MMEVVVKIGDLKVTSHPDTLVTRALGSCVAVCLYHAAKQLGGLCHLVLPDSSIARTDQYNPAKFADTGIQALLNEMKQLGCTTRGLEAKIVGGASMFGNLTDSLNIGAKNTTAATQILNDLNIPIIGEDTGGNFGRTATFFLDSGMIGVTSFKREKLTI